MGGWATTPTHHPARERFLQRTFERICRIYMRFVEIISDLYFFVYKSFLQGGQRGQPGGEDEGTMPRAKRRTGKARGGPNKANHKIAWNNNLLAYQQRVGLKEHPICFATPDSERSNEGALSRGRGGVGGFLFCSGLWSRLGLARRG